MTEVAAALFEFTFLCQIAGSLALLTARMMSKRSLPSSAGWYRDVGYRLIKMGAATGLVAALLVAVP